MRKLCKKCQYLIDDSMATCKHCGAVICEDNTVYINEAEDLQKLPTLQELREPESERKFLKCEKCGAEITTDAEFCKSCGTAIIVFLFKMRYKAKRWSRILPQMRGK